MQRGTRTVWGSGLRAAAVLGAAGCWLGAITASPALAARSPRSPPVQVVLSTANLGDALTPMPDLAFQRLPVGQRRVIHVNDSVRYQRVTGFGAAMTDTSAWLIHHELTPAARAGLMSELFSRQGIDLNFMRVPMGASDFSATGVPYTYDDLPAGRTDPGLHDFSVAHDDAYILPTLRQMLAVNPGVEIVANPWSPPPWMKSNDQFNNLYGGGSLLAADYPVLANYFLRFIRAYRQAGVPVAAVTPQNEPLAETPYPGAQMSPSAEARFTASYLRPALNQAGLRTKIYGVDDGTHLFYAQQLLASRARGAFSGIAWHCYGGLGAASILHRQYPAEEQIVSECSPGIIPYSGLEAAISATRNWAGAVALWNLALDPSGGPVEEPDRGCPDCTGVVTISEQTHHVYLATNYFEFGQLSKYVHRGAVRIASDRFVSDFHTAAGQYGVTPGLDNVAFINRDGTRVLVADNTSRATIRFTVAWRRRSFRYALAPGAAVTFIWR